MEKQIRSFLGDGVVALRPVTRADLPLLARWRNEPELRSRTREFRPLGDLDQERWYERISGPDRRDFMFVVEAEVADDGPEGSQPIGVVGLCYWEPRDRTAEVSFYIGEVAARGQGYATRAVRLLCRWGFAEVGLERIFAEVFESNEASQKLLSKIGFVEEGRLRSHVFRQGRRWDSVMMGLLAIDPERVRSIEDLLDQIGLSGSAP